MRENLARLLSIFVGFRFVGIGFAVEIYCFARLYCFARFSARAFKSGCDKFTHVFLLFANCTLYSQGRTRLNSLF